MHISRLKWCINKVIPTIIVVTKQIINITNFHIVCRNIYNYFVYYQDHFILEYKRLSLSLNICCV